MTGAIEFLCKAKVICESKENCKACRMGNKLKEILDKEAERIKG